MTLFSLSAIAAQPDYPLSRIDDSSVLRLDARDGFNEYGAVVSTIGDINADGIGDLLVTDPSEKGDAPAAAGNRYVVFGIKPGLAQAHSLSHLDGSDGFRLTGKAGQDNADIAVSAAGDVNGDGIDDLLIGDPSASPGARPLAGSAFVVFGRSAGFPPRLSVSRLDGSNGFSLDGEFAGDGFGQSVNAARDINGDGIDDIVIGTDGTSADRSPTAGRSYVIFGRTTEFPATFVLSRLNGSNGFHFDEANGFGRIAHDADDFAHARSSMRGEFRGIDETSSRP